MVEYERERDSPDCAERVERARFGKASVGAPRGLFRRFLSPHIAKNVLSILNFDNFSTYRRPVQPDCALSMFGC
jgi:hypothetical protein